MDSRFFGGVLLVAGTTIGAAVLALPVSTGVAGFWPSIALFFLCWCYLTFTALLFCEVDLYMEGDVNFVTMAKRTLGIPGQVLAWVAYLFLLYMLTTAYLAVGGPLFIEFGEMVTGYNLPDWAGPIPLLAIFGWFVFEGAHSVDLLNRFLMLGLGVAFVILMIFLSPAIDADLLEHQDWHFFSSATSVIVTAFGFHIIIPTLSTYMGRDAKRLRGVVIVGSLIPLVIYCLWEFLTLGVLSVEGQGGLMQAYELGAPVTRPLRFLFGSRWVSVGAQCFEAFAILTSFLGVSLSLLDFLADGLHVKKNFRGRLLLCVLTFVPPLFFSLTYPRAFFIALGFAGGIGVAVLLGLLPVLMAWWGRYRRKLEGPYRAPGGRYALIAAGVVSLLVVLHEIFSKSV